MRVEGTIGFAPVHEGRILGPNEFELLASEEQAKFKKDIAELHEQLRQRMGQLPHWAKEARDKLTQLSREVTEITVNVALAELLARYHDLPEVSAHLVAMRSDIVEHADDFRENGAGPRVLAALAEERPLQRYAVNLFVDHADSVAAPVVYADEPSVDDLLGRIEHRGWLGNLVSDFTLIKPGALHRANGGFLVVDALKILHMPHAWESLKRTLFASKIRIEPLSRILGLSSSVTLEPEPIPLDVKVVLVGDHTVYGLLSELDPDVGELFRLVAEFDDRVDRDGEGELCLARCVAGATARYGLLPLDREAVARVIEDASRRAGDSHKLSSSLRELEALLREADHHARDRDAERIGAHDIDASVDTRIRLRNLFEQRTKEAIVRGKVLVDTQGAKVGQVNGLSVLQLGDYAFGRPTRITATVRLGDGKVIDIEREVELGGPLHSKGVLILSSYLASRYARLLPWSLSASLVFEQSYVGVEGDSASLAELCALLSAIADVPIKQSIAVTGSVNQLGGVQAVGGLNEKIEGFFDLCRERGLTGEQAVIVPASNLASLMLRDDLVDACAAGRFHIYAVDTADEAIELLTGMVVGDEDAEGEFPEDSVNGRIAQQLLQFAVIAETFGKLVRTEDETQDDDATVGPAAATGEP
jgi:lon-related putative ATP-dependent protease